MADLTLIGLVEELAARFEGAGLHYGHGTDNPWDEAVALVLGALDVPYANSADRQHESLAAQDVARLRALATRRIEERVPVPYLTGVGWFLGLPFTVTPDVLIPRSPFGELLADGCQPWIGALQPRRILDLGTGCGCIGIAAAQVFEEATVDLADIDPAALAVARANVVRHGLGARVQVREADLFAGLDGPYDLILSNPPYVDAQDMATLPAEFHHEPRGALAAGEDGLDIVARILADAPRMLAPDGVLMVEVGNSAEAVLRRWPDLPLLWPEFEAGGHGVFVVRAAELA